MTNDDLTQGEKAALTPRLRNRFVHGSLTIPKTKDLVDSEEYQRRLKTSLMRDQALVKQEKQKRIEKSLIEWRRRVGKTFANATTEDPRITERVSRLANQDGLHKTSLIFYGELGVGKSWNAYSFINKALELGAVTPGQVVADTETGVLGRIATSGFKRAELLEELFSPAHKIFFIDDVGTGYFGAANTEQSRTEIWYELIDYIYNHQLTLLITTNKKLTDSSLGAWMGARAFDRLRVIVGSDGAIQPGVVNRRPSVLEENERTYHKK